MQTLPAQGLFLRLVQRAMEILCYAFSLMVVCAVVGIYCFLNSGYKDKDDAHNKKNLGRIRTTSMLLVVIAFLSGALFFALVSRGRVNLTAAMSPPAEEPPPPELPSE